jgi:DNA-binding transcriptional MerR regulator
MTAMSNTEHYLSPSEAARRLGVSVKALRLYERHGLVTPLRSATGWRAYGPEQIARLHQVLALKRLGLPLARIAELLSGRLAALGDVLAVQEQLLTGERARVSHALALVQAARAKLEAGAQLSIDDLTELTKETTMTKKTTPEEIKAIFDPLAAKYFAPEEIEHLTDREWAQEEVGARWEKVLADARAAMAEGDPTSSAAADVARRWKALVDEFTGGDPAVAGKVRAIWDDAMADPKAAPKLPITPDMFAFVGKAMEALKATGG